MPTLKISRPLEKYNRHSEYQILINNKKYGVLPNGSEWHTDMPEGGIRLQIKRRWALSPTKTLHLQGDGQNLQVRANPFLPKLFIGFGLLFILMTAFASLINPIPGVKYVPAALIAAFMLAMLYFFSMGRKHWLQIRG